VYVCVCEGERELPFHSLRETEKGRFVWDRVRAMVRAQEIKPYTSTINRYVCELACVFVLACVCRLD